MTSNSSQADRKVLQWMVLAAFGAVFIVALVFWRGHALRDGFVNPWLIAAAALGVFAAALYYRQPWSRWLGMGIVAIGLLNSVWLFATEDFPWLLGFAAAVQIWFLWEIWRMEVKPRVAEEDDDEPHLSLVLLLREPIYLESSMLAEMASRAWDAEVVAVASEDEEEADPLDTPDSESFVTGDPPHFICTHWPGFFTINNFDEPYFEDVDEVAESIQEVRVRGAIEQHQAWTSVDLVHWFGDEGDGGRREAYRQIARLLAEMADDNCLAVIDPAASMIFAYDPETEEKLRSDDPLEALREWYYAPILAIEADDPEMQAAAAEAQRRWPEFVSAFEKRDPDGDAPYLVKAPFTDGDHTEFMWVRVTGMENEIVYGILENSPANVGDVAEGDVVRVRAQDVNDWLCVINKKTAGAFTMKVLNQRTEGQDKD